MKKRIIPFLLAAAVLLAVLAPAASAGGITKYVYTRNGKPLNVRSWPSVNSALLGTIPYGQAVTVENYTTDYTWAVISFGGRTAYVMTQYLVDGSPVSPVTPTPTPGGNTQSLINSMENEFRTYRVVSPYTVLAKPVRASGWVNLRWAPSLSAEIMATYKQNDKLLVIKELKNWYQVEDQSTGNVGFISKKYVVK